MKIKILVIALLSTLSCVATTLEDKVAEILTNVVTAADSKSAKKIVKQTRLLRNVERPHLRHLRRTVDSVLAEKGVGSHWHAVATWPKISEISRQEKGLHTNMVNAINIAKKYRVDISPYGMLRASRPTLSEIVLVWNDFLANTQYVNLQWLSILEEWLDDHAHDLIVKYLEKKGIDPEHETEGVDVYEEKYIKALTSPRLAGFNEFLESIGIKERLDLSPLDAEFCEEVKTKVLSGEWPLHKQNEIRLRLHLGVEGYNNFMKEYLK